MVFTSIVLGQKYHMLFTEQQGGEKAARMEEWEFSPQQRQPVQMAA